MQSTYINVQAIKLISMYFQGQHQSYEDYKEKFESLWSVIEQLGGSHALHPGLIQKPTVDIQTEGLM